MNGYKLILGSLVRNSLQVIFAFLIAHNALTHDQVSILPVNDMVVGIVGGICTIGWSLYQKAEARWKFLAALNADPNTSSAEINTAAKSAPTTEKIASLAGK